MKNCLNVIGGLRKRFQTIVTMVIYKIHQAEQMIKYVTVVWTVYFPY